jgi:dihydrofolate reductase
MRNVILKMELSLDGFIGKPDSDDPSWLLRYYDEELTAYVVSLLESAGVHAMGRQAYEDMAPYWQASEGPIADAMNGTPKAVFSRTLPEATWPETTIHRGALEDEIAALKRQDGGPILVHGGSRFVQALTRADLIDEYRLNLHPTALGAGVRLFGGATQLNLSSARTFPRGTVALTYIRLAETADRG